MTALAKVLLVDDEREFVAILKGMSPLAASDGQPGNWEEPGFFLRRVEAAKSQENGWQEPYESRDSRTDLRGTGGKTPPVYPTLDKPAPYNPRTTSIPLQ